MDGKVKDKDKGSNGFRLTAIDHLVLRSAQPESLIAFYCEQLKCHLERQLPEYGLSQLRAGTALIDIIDTNSPMGQAGGPAPSAQGNNLDHFCLRFEGISAAELAQELRQQGIAIEEPETRYGAQGSGPSVYLKDPDGNQLELRAEQDFEVS